MMQAEYIDRLIEEIEREALEKYSTLNDNLWELERRGKGILARKVRELVDLMEDVKAFVYRRTKHWSIQVGDGVVVVSGKLEGFPLDIRDATNMTIREIITKFFEHEEFLRLLLSKFERWLYTVLAELTSEHLKETTSEQH
jgi:hypothetical protein